ncbi:negative elongation factor E [Culicoides brevitarsis]|uniref:negative elongation factor E n=1 Tax=Culicoides brevitarsis TaxID=469753 RepID=UPI00307BE161
MVYITFPNNLTEEELMLQAKYQKLKKKKKALQILKVPKQEVEKPKLNIKRAEGAREVARKLLKSGAVAIKPVKQEQVSFKRPKNQERKKAASDMSPVAAYQPFSASTSDSDHGARKEAASEKMDTTEGASGAARYQNLYQHFASERDKEERGVSDKAETKDKRTGNTIYVSGNKISEDYLRKHFSDFGQILNISMETEKYRGFITFNKPEAAETAIVEMHTKSIAGITLQVSLARRQPQIEPINDASSSAVWSTLASNQSQKGNHKADRRELPTYNDLDMF